MGHRRVGLAVAVLLLLAVPARAAELPGSPLSLRDAESLALRLNPWLQAAASNQEIAAARVREARGGWLPSIELSETVTRSNNPVFVFGSLLEQGRFGQSNFALDALNDPKPLTNFRTAASFRYAAFEQFQTETGVSRARLGAEQAGAQRTQAEQQVRYQVIRAYFGVLVAEARVQVAEEAVRTAEADRDRVQDLYRTGLVVQSDLLATEVQLAEFHQQRIQASGERVTAYAALNTAIGLPVGAPQTLTGELEERVFSVDEVAELQSRALGSRPDYLQATLAAEMAAEGARAARGQYWPRLDLFGTYAGSDDGPGIESTDYLLGAGLTFNLLAPGRSSRLDQARASVEVRRAERQRVANQVSFEVVQAHEQFRSARERLDVANRAVDQAREALRIVQDRYQEGLSTITEVLRAETAQVRARLNLLACRYDVYLGYAQVLLATGQLTDVSPFAS